VRSVDTPNTMESSEIATQSAGRFTSCLSCGDVIEIPITPIGGQSPQARCVPCRRTFENAKQNHERHRSYQTRAWRTLSRAMRREACCSVCGTREDLTGDHLPGAWERVDAGLPLRPGLDVDVKCRRCNGDAGPTRPGFAHLRRSP
jgi:hypothetical protein